MHRLVAGTNMYVKSYQFLPKETTFLFSIHARRIQTTRKRRFLPYPNPSTHLGSTIPPVLHRHAFLKMIVYGPHPNQRARMGHCHGQHECFTMMRMDIINPETVTWTRQQQHTTGVRVKMPTQSIYIKKLGQQ
jgi:hypothetical protein